MTKTTKMKKTVWFIVMIVLFVGIIGTACFLHIESTGIDNIYFGTPGWLLECQEGNPTHEQETEWGYERTYENKNYLGEKCRVVYTNVLGMNQMHLYYENADEGLYQSIVEQLVNKYEMKTDYYVEDEVISDEMRSIEFGTDHGATGIQVQVEWIETDLVVQLIANY